MEVRRRRPALLVPCTLLDAGNAELPLLDLVLPQHANTPTAATPATARSATCTGAGAAMLGPSVAGLLGALLCQRGRRAAARALAAPRSSAMYLCATPRRAHACTRPPGAGPLAAGWSAAAERGQIIHNHNHNHNSLKIQTQSQIIKDKRLHVNTRNNYIYDNR